jgi:hypothetical protein
MIQVKPGLEFRAAAPANAPGDARIADH